MNPIATSIQKSGRQAETRSTVDALAELEAIAPPADLSDPDLTENAITVLERRYLKKDPTTGKVCETPRELFWRVADVEFSHDRHGVRGLQMTFF